MNLEYKCTICKDKGFLSNGNKCNCLKQEIISSTYKMSNLSRILDKENYDNFNLSLFSTEKGENNISPFENMETNILPICNEFIKNSTPEESANSISYFLRHTPGLKKESIGNYLGENSPFELKVLSMYANSFNYKDQHLLSALRLFLSTFKLPGESQKIDRILEQFAIKYHKDNPSSFE